MSSPRDSEQKFYWQLSEWENFTKYNKSIPTWRQRYHCLLQYLLLVIKLTLFKHIRSSTDYIIFRKLKIITIKMTVVKPCSWLLNMQPLRHWHTHINHKHTTELFSMRCGIRSCPNITDWRHAPCPLVSHNSSSKLKTHTFTPWNEKLSHCNTQPL